MMARQNNIPIYTGLYCPCCKQMTRRQWQQPSMMPNRPAHSQTDCLNPKCAGYYATLSIESFFERYGQNKLQSEE